MLETELKCIITEELYNKIKSSFKWNYTAEQINTYYTDAEGELQKRRAMVRVRVNNGVSTLLIRLLKNPGEPVQLCEEAEDPIDG
ncbi:MAG: CYTH domain-containing protein, partial [Oscillospiraceae bacterium]|nr:CYTH domain-containing protein [Oscillospiraceae bacterium]